MEVTGGSCGEELASVTTSWPGSVTFSEELAIGTSVAGALGRVDRDPSLDAGIGSGSSSMGETAVEGTKFDEWNASEVALELW